MVKTIHIHGQCYVAVALQALQCFAPSHGRRCSSRGRKGDLLLQVLQGRKGYLLQGQEGELLLLLGALWARDFILVDEKEVSLSNSFGDTKEISFKDENEKSFFLLKSFMNKQNISSLLKEEKDISFLS